MDIALWVAQVLLAAVFLGSGTVKVWWSKERLVASGQTGVGPLPLAVVRMTAVCELLAVVGLIGPWATGIAPVLTPVAAVGLALVMAGAMISHGSLLRADLMAGRGTKEVRNLVTNVLLLGLCLFVAVGRF